MKLSALKLLKGIASYPNHVTLSERCNSDGTAVRIDLYVLYVNEGARQAYQVDARNGLYREAALSDGPSTFGAWQALEAE